MGLPAINITFTAAQEAAIDAALTALETNCPFRVNIAASAKDGEQSLDVKRYPFVQNAILNTAPANPTLQPPFLSVADAGNDLNLYNQFTPKIERLKAILESYMDTQWLAGVEAYFYFRKFYAMLQEAVEANVPGADSLLADAKRLYEN